MADNELMAAWCNEHALRWHHLTPEQADRAEGLARRAVAMACIPSHIQGGLIRWIVKGIPTGSFLKAVLSNDLLEACARADEECRASLFDLVKFLYNDAPGNCWGSPERVAAWPAIASPPIKPDEVPY